MVLNAFALVIDLHLAGILEIHLILLLPSCFFFLYPENDIEVALNLIFIFIFHFKLTILYFIIHGKIPKNNLWIETINENLSKLSVPRAFHWANILNCESLIIELIRLCSIMFEILVKFEFNRLIGHADSRNYFLEASTKYRTWPAQHFQLNLISWVLDKRFHITPRYYLLVWFIQLNKPLTNKFFLSTKVSVLLIFTFISLNVFISLIQNDSFEYRAH